MRREHVWLLQHPELYTAGTSANSSDLVDPDLFPVYTSQRGGQYTYHGPGQRIAYVMLDLNKRGKDVRKYVNSLEEWIIQTLAEFNIKGERRKDRVGVWVVRKDKPLSPSGDFLEDKIAAVGVRLRKWISFHGIAINVNPNLDHYKGIVPCGIQHHGVTSLADLGLEASMDDLDNALSKTFKNVFGKE
jgi:lipoyl(octanoyl) transferase